jgi:branched-subunit amino acid ABC-type transport system permease component
MRIVKFRPRRPVHAGCFRRLFARQWSGNFWVALAGAADTRRTFRCPPSKFAILRRLYRRDAHAFLMVTFGLALVVGEAVRLTWGSDCAAGPAPPRLAA